MNLFINQKQTLRHRKKIKIKTIVTKGKGKVRNKLGVLDELIYTI